MKLEITFIAIASVEIPDATIQQWAELGGEDQKQEAFQSWVSEWMVGKLLIERQPDKPDKGIVVLLSKAFGEPVISARMQEESDEPS